MLKNNNTYIEVYTHTRVYIYIYIYTLVTLDNNILNLITYKNLMYLI